MIDVKQTEQTIEEIYSYYRNAGSNERKHFNKSFIYKNFNINNENSKLIFEAIKNKGVVLSKIKIEEKGAIKSKLMTFKVPSPVKHPGVAIKVSGFDTINPNDFYDDVLEDEEVQQDVSPFKSKGFIKTKTVFATKEDDNTF